MKINKLINLILKGIGLAMGIAVLVLNILGEMDVNSSIKLLAIGMTAFGIYALNEK